MINKTPTGLKRTTSPLNGRECYLYTMQGTYPAVIVNAGILWHGKRKLVQVKALGAKYSIMVYDTVAQGKFDREEKPTFYAC